MSGQQQQQQPAIDPRLAASIGTTTLPPPSQFNLPPQFASNTSGPASENNNLYPQPYPTSNSHTSQQPGTDTSSASHSNQASPEDANHAAIDDGDDNSPDNDNERQNGEDPKRPRACEACRGLKVRCDQDPERPELPCRRCQKAGRQCIITVPSRKRQKKADSRVAELEKKLDALTAALQQQQSGHAHYGSPPGAFDVTPGRASTASLQPHSSPGSVRPNSTRPMSMQPPHKRQRLEESLRETESLDGADTINTDPLARYRTPSTNGHAAANRVPQVGNSWIPNAESMTQLTHRSPEEFMNRINSLVNPEMSASIFDQYVTQRAPHMPAVVFPPGTTAEQVCREKPILYTCIISVTGAGTFHPELTRQLGREAIRAIADCVVCNGAKSLELIQALQVLALWYRPPERAEQSNFYQLIHMAAVMAVDIGLGKRFNASKARRGFGGPHADYAPGPALVMPQNSDTLEARRAWLGCYYLCASASMVLRRPNLLRWSNYMNECVDILESSSEAYASDKLFCQHIKVQHICENIGLEFLMDDNTATVSITDSRVTYALNVLENELKAWTDQIPPEVRHHPELRFFEHVASLYLHEIALHMNHNVEDFKLPFTEESLRSVNNSNEMLTQHQIAALEACRKAAHGVLDVMLSLEVEVVKSLPMLIYFVRCTYAIVILIKMHVAVSTPGSEISKIMTAEAVRVDYYMEALIKIFAQVAGGSRDCLQHPKVLRIFSVLKEWFSRHKENMAAQARGEQLPHPNNRSQMEQRPADEGAKYNQTPLQLLSQVAAGDQHQSQLGSESRDWTFNSPFPVDYARQPHSSHPDSKWPIYQQHPQAPQQQSTFPPASNVDPALAGGISDPATMFGMDGSLSAEYVWGTGFEQAMDINLGNMDELAGGVMDGLFLGGGMAPFGFNGDTNGAGQW